MCLFVLLVTNSYSSVIQLTHVDFQNDYLCLDIGTDFEFEQKALLEKCTITECTVKPILLPMFSDLRWNNVGLLGGRAIIEMLQTNKILTRIELAGNNIPADILKAIGNNIPADILNAIGNNIPTDILKAIGNNIPADILKAIGNNIPADILKAIGNNIPADILKAIGNNIPTDILKAIGNWLKYPI